MAEKSNKLYCWHGTRSLKTAKKILKKGFKPWTYFAKHLEDALAFGGKYVFMVEFEADKVPDNWQFMVEKVYPASRIVSLKKYNQYDIVKEKDGSKK